MKTGAVWIWAGVVLAVGMCLAAADLVADEATPMQMIPMTPVGPSTTAPAVAAPATARASQSEKSVHPEVLESLQPEAVTPASAPTAVAADSSPVDDRDEPVRPIRENTPEKPFGGRRPLPLVPDAATASAVGDDAGAKTAPAAQPLIREGKRFAERRAKASREGDLTVLLLDGVSRPVVLVRTRPLERIEELSDYGRKEIEFIVSGIVTEYRGRNYLLLDSFRVPRVESDDRPYDETGEPAWEVSSGTDGAGATTNTAAPSPRDRTAAPEPIDRSVPEPPPVVEPDVRRPLPVRPPTGAVVEAAPLRQDKRLTDREGRIIRRNDQTLFVFDGGDKPLVLLPNAKLQQVEDTADFGRRPVRFRISGTVTEYRGENYLMLSKMVVVPKEIEKL